MNTELEESLVTSFPMLYRKVPGSAFDGRFDCGDGCEFIIRRLSARLEPLVVRALVDDGLAALDPAAAGREPVVYLGALEKVRGRLFITLAGRGITSDMLAATTFAAREALITCEECGAPGSFQTSGQLQRTVCKRHGRLRP